jgi:hypothetical protein
LLKGHAFLRVAQRNEYSELFKHHAQTKERLLEASEGLKDLESARKALAKLEGELASEVDRRNSIVCTHATVHQR